MSVRSQAVSVLSLVFVAGVLAACGSSGGTTSTIGSSGTSGSSSSGTSSTTGGYVDGKTFTMATAADPGTMDPQASYAMLTIAPFAYDTLIGVDAKGTFQSQLASSWKVSGNTVTFELRDDVTCSDGTPFTAKTVVDNIAYVADIKNASPIRGVYLPVDATGSASGSTVTVTLPAPSPFVLDGFAHFPMVCESGIQNRDSLKSGSSGTGPYTLTEAVPGDHYTFTVRKDYAWGMDGADTAQQGIPATVVIKVVTNETTAANLVLSGQVNVADLIGPDSTRLTKAGVPYLESERVYAEQLYNQAPGRIAADPVVRKALTQALDLDKLQKVITSGLGTTPSRLAVYAPGVCEGNTIEGNLPTTDLSAAAADLAADGWTKGKDGILTKDGKKLSLTFVYPNQGAGQTAAAELEVAALQQLGVDVTSKALAGAEVTATLYQTGDWDVAWAAPSASNPQLLVSFVSGPSPAEGGNNFSSIANRDYDAHVKTAMTKIGNDGCADWQAAEEALFRASDVVPFANIVVRTFHQGANLVRVGDNIVPTSIRILG